jgi:hypothetical protein
VTYGLFDVEVAVRSTAAPTDLWPLDGDWWRDGQPPLDQDQGEQLLTGERAGMICT